MELLYQDQDLAVIIKPVGMDSEHQLPQAISEQIGGDIFPVHRLDLNVAGVMVYARTKTAAAKLSQLIQQGLLIKEYRAIVHGLPPEESVFEDFLFKDGRKNKVFVVKKQRSGVKKAKLSYTRLTDESPCVVHIRLFTGRSHQIRVQFASRGYPLLGDHKYGARDRESLPFLYSCRILFPWKGNNMVFESYPDWAEQKSTCSNARGS